MKVFLISLIIFLNCLNFSQIIWLSMQYTEKLQMKLSKISSIIFFFPFNQLHCQTDQKPRTYPEVVNFISYIALSKSYKTGMHKLRGCNIGYNVHD